jgi:deoxyadenosine/deoxycytidine kinase
MRIAIFGTVGAGKTTLIENLLKRLPDTYQVFLEPMDENPYFKDFYNEGAANDESLNYKMEI